MINCSSFEMSHILTEFPIPFTGPNMCDSNAYIFMAAETEWRNQPYGIAAESTASSSCSIHCPICPQTDPTIWKYFMSVHSEEKHIGSYQVRAPLEALQLWKISDENLGKTKESKDEHIREPSRIMTVPSVVRHYQDWCPGSDVVNPTRLTRLVSFS